MVSRKKKVASLKLPTCETSEKCPELPKHVIAEEALKLLKEGKERVATTVQKWTLVLIGRIYELEKL